MKKLILTMCFFVWGLNSVLWAQSEDPLANLRQKNLQVESEGNEIVDLEKEIRMNGRLQWSPFVFHPRLALINDFNNNLNEGMLEDDVTSQVSKGQQRDYFFTLAPGGSIVFRNEYMPFSIGYQTLATWFTKYNEFNALQHQAFFIGKFLREYWRLVGEVKFNKFAQAGKNVSGQTTDIFDTEYFKEKILLEIDLPPFWFFRENAFEFQIIRYDDVAQGLKAHYTDLQVGFNTALGPNLTLGILAGAQKRRYGVRGGGLREFRDFLGFVGAVKIDWKLSDKASISVEVVGDLEDDQFGDSGYKYTDSYTIKYNRQLAKFWSFSIGPTITVERFGRINRDVRFPIKKRQDIRYLGAVEVTYQFTTWCRFSFAYTYTFIDSNMDIFQTEEHTVVALMELGV